MSRGLAEIRGYLVSGESAESWLGICEGMEETGYGGSGDVVCKSRRWLFKAFRP